jgi:hypothetical protein
MVAVTAFSDQYFPERLPEAERYMMQLDAMGDSAAYWRFEARRELLRTYYMLGRTDDVIRNGEQTLALLPVMSFWDRGLMFPISFHGGDGLIYIAMVEALTGRPGGAAKIAAMNKLLADISVPSAKLVALDSGFWYRGQDYQRALRPLILANAKLGTTGAPIVSNYWVNRGASTDSAAIQLNDGKIHVLGTTAYT